MHGHYIYLKVHGHPLLVPRGGCSGSSNSTARSSSSAGLDPFQLFKHGHLKQRKKDLHLRQKGGPLSTTVNIARIMLQSCVMVPVPDPFTHPSLIHEKNTGQQQEPHNAGDGDQNATHSSPPPALHYTMLDTKGMSPEEIWNYSRHLWWRALQKVSGGASITEKAIEKEKAASKTMGKERPMASILCLPTLACRRYVAYRAGLTMRALCRIKKKFMHQSLKMSILRMKYHQTISIKYKTPFMKWLWVARTYIIERFERAVGLQKNLRRYLVHKHYNFLRNASIVFQKYVSTHHVLNKYFCWKNHPSLVRCSGFLRLHFTRDGVLSLTLYAPLRCLFSPIYICRCEEDWVESKQ